MEARLARPFPSLHGIWCQAGAVPIAPSPRAWRRLRRWVD